MRIVPDSKLEISSKQSADFIENGLTIVEIGGFELFVHSN